MGKENEADVPGPAVEFHSEGEYKREKAREIVSYIVNGRRRSWEVNPVPAFTTDAHGMPIITSRFDITHELFKLAGKMVALLGEGTYWEEADEFSKILAYLEKEWDTAWSWDNDD